MDFELRAAKEKLEREQRERKEKARISGERERKAREEARRRLDSLEALHRARRMQSALAAQQAIDREEEDLAIGNGIRFNTILHAIPYHGFGDKIKLPPSCFDELSTQGALDKGPMLFELSTVNEPENSVSMEQKTTHSGVLEFTASEGFAELPPQLWQNLFPVNSNSPLIRIRYVRLPKGIYAKLQPEVLGFSDIPNHRAVLETTLRQHAALSEGDLLLVHHGGMEYRLRVLELKPDSSISVLETDIEVDITEPSAVAANMGHGMLIPLVLGKPETGVVEEGKYNYYKFSIDSKIYEDAADGDLNILVNLVMDNNDTNGDADLYVSHHPFLFPTQHQHQWSSHDVGTKVVCLTGRGISLTADTYSIGVFGFRGISNYKITIDCQPSVQSGAVGQKVGTDLVSSSQKGADAEQCQNCKQLVPARTIALHEAYCKRHNIVCQYKSCGVILRRDEAGKHVHCSKCGKAFQQEEMGKHIKVFHEPLHCGCGEVLEKEEMVIHQSSVCPLRVVTCRFCGDMVPAGNTPDDVRDRIRGYSEHESLCGSRTSPCDFCGRAIMLKEMDLHRSAVHEKLASENEKSAVSRSFMELDSDGAVDHSAPQISTFQSQTSHSTQNQSVESLACPICNQIFIGTNSVWQLNIHLDKKHFNNIAHNNGSKNIPSMPDDSIRAQNMTARTMVVSCPICGMSVHSERDLSQHIDLVH
ncbi:hypothetical protein KI387_026782 [Taxus chinensis]|uniref:C2H2-type domain-containing protein n=1 Tax=Taxus chinensis TaxID=29808 RepID=A0AA38FV70_TAXCH|nr:hypothetical protein KI387_026782 [Taxus chinensis]